MASVQGGFTTPGGGFIFGPNVSVSTNQPNQFGGTTTYGTNSQGQAYQRVGVQVGLQNTAAFNQNVQNMLSGGGSSAPKPIVTPQVAAISVAPSVSPGASLGTPTVEFASQPTSQSASVPLSVASAPAPTATPTQALLSGTGLQSTLRQNFNYSPLASYPESTQTGPNAGNSASLVNQAPNSTASILNPQNYNEYSLNADQAFRLSEISPGAYSSLIANAPVSVYIPKNTNQGIINFILGTPNASQPFPTGAFSLPAGGTEFVSYKFSNQPSLPQTSAGQPILSQNTVNTLLNSPATANEFTIGNPALIPQGGAKYFDALIQAAIEHPTQLLGAALIPSGGLTVNQLVAQEQNTLQNQVNQFGVFGAIEQRAESFPGLLVSPFTTPSQTVNAGYSTNKGNVNNPVIVPGGQINIPFYGGVGPHIPGATGEVTLPSIPATFLGAELATGVVAPAAAGAASTIGAAATQVPVLGPALATGASLASAAGTAVGNLPLYYEEGATIGSSVAPPTAFTIANLAQALGPTGAVGGALLANPTAAAAIRAAPYFASGVLIATPAAASGLLAAEAQAQAGGTTPQIERAFLQNFAGGLALSGATAAGAAAGKNPLNVQIPTSQQAVKATQVTGFTISDDAELNAGPGQPISYTTSVQPVTKTSVSTQFYVNPETGEVELPGEIQAGNQLSPQEPTFNTYYQAVRQDILGENQAASVTTESGRALIEPYENSGRTFVFSVPAETQDLFTNSEEQGGIVGRYNTENFFPDLTKSENLITFTPSESNTLGTIPSNQVFSQLGQPVNPTPGQFVFNAEGEASPSMVFANQPQVLPIKVSISGVPLSPLSQTQFDFQTGNIVLPSGASATVPVISSSEPIFGTVANPEQNLNFFPPVQSTRSIYSATLNFVNPFTSSPAPVTAPLSPEDIAEARPNIGTLGVPLVDVSPGGQFDLIGNANTLPQPGSIRVLTAEQVGQINALPTLGENPSPEEIQGRVNQLSDILNIKAPGVTTLGKDTFAQAGDLFTPQESQTTLPQYPSANIVTPEGFNQLLSASQVSQINQLPPLSLSASPAEIQGRVNQLSDILGIQSPTVIEFPQSETGAIDSGLQKGLVSGGIYQPSTNQLAINTQAISNAVGLSNPNALPADINQLVLHEELHAFVAQTPSLASMSQFTPEEQQGLFVSGYNPTQLGNEIEENFVRNFAQTVQQGGNILYNPTSGGFISAPPVQSLIVGPSEGFSSPATKLGEYSPTSNQIVLYNTANSGVNVLSMANDEFAANANGQISNPLTETVTHEVFHALQNQNPLIQDAPSVFDQNLEPQYGTGTGTGGEQFVRGLLNTVNAAPNGDIYYNPSSGNFLSVPPATTGVTSGLSIPTNLGSVLGAASTQLIQVPGALNVPVFTPLAVAQPLQVQQFMSTRQAGNLVFPTSQMQVQPQVSIQQPLSVIVVPKTLVQPQIQTFTSPSTNTSSESNTSTSTTTTTTTTTESSGSFSFPSIQEFVIPPLETILPKNKKSGLLQVPTVKKKQGFLVFSRIKGKFEQVYPTALPFGKALEEGAEFVTSHIAATFRVVPSNKQPNVNAPIKSTTLPAIQAVFNTPSKGSKLNAPLTFIQPRGLRLASQGERAELKAAKFRSGNGKKGL